MFLSAMDGHNADLKNMNIGATFFEPTKMVSLQIILFWTYCLLLALIEMQ
jgi:hypothetical protein